jgi:orotate phosphoribosyltransferase
MQNYQREFIKLSLSCGVLRFGEFTLKSGRVSPYFFNSGLFNSGASLALLGRYYAEAVQHAGVNYDMLFGPAYKGIPLVATVSIALAQDQGRDVPYAFNRKEAKDHGEGGVTVGAKLSGKVLIVDDVITAGTSVNESVAIIRAAGAEPVGVVIALDRQERGTGNLSAIAEVTAHHGIQVINVVNLGHLVEYLDSLPGVSADLDRILAYQRAYCA